jgi:hypothetical protein
VWGRVQNPVPHTHTHKVLSDYNLCRCVYSQTCSEQLSTGSALTNPALWRLFSKCMVKSCTPGRPGQARTPNCSSLCSEYLNAESVINFRPNVLSIELLADVLRTENPYFSGTGLVPPPKQFLSVLPIPVTSYHHASSPGWNFTAAPLNLSSSHPRSCVTVPSLWQRTTPLHGSSPKAFSPCPYCFMFLCHAYH